MSKRKAMDKQEARERRNRLLQSAAAAELSLTEGVRQMRTVTGMTQEEFAHHRGVSARVIKAIERGQGNPTVATLNRIGELFGLEVAFVPKRRQVTLIEQQSAVQVGTDVANRKFPESLAGAPMKSISDVVNLIEERDKSSTLSPRSVWDSVLHRRYDEMTQFLRQADTFETLRQQLSRADILSEQLKSVDVLAQKLDKAETLIVQLKQAESWSNELKKVELLSQNLKKAELLSHDLKKAELLSKDLKKAETLGSQLKEMQGLSEKLKGIERLSQQLDDLNGLTARINHGQERGRKKE